MRAAIIIVFAALIALVCAQVNLKATAVATITENGQVAHTINLAADANGPVPGQSGVYTGTISGSVDGSNSTSIQAQVTVDAAAGTINYYSADVNQLVVLEAVKAIIAQDQNLAPLITLASNLPLVKSVIAQLGFPVNVTVSLAELAQTATVLNLQIATTASSITVTTPSINNVTASVVINYSVGAASTTAKPTGADISGNNNAQRSSAIKYGASAGLLAASALLML